MSHFERQLGVLKAVLKSTLTRTENLHAPGDSRLESVGSDIVENALHRPISWSALLLLTAQTGDWH